MASAKRIPANIDKVLKDVYNRLLVGKSPKRFIAKVAKDMIDKKEFRSCLSTARRKGFSEGIDEERKKNEIARAARDKKNCRIPTLNRSFGGSCRYGSCHQIEFQDFANS